MSCCTETTTLDKGSIGEEILTTWFHENNIPFFPIRQSPETFAHFFINTGKRPDFFVLLQSLGTIAVDAKNCALSQGYFTITKQELMKALSFEMVTRIPLWFAFLNIQHNFASWYWISTMKAMEGGITRVNRHTGEEFFAIHLSNFIGISSSADFGQLYTCQLQSAPVISRLIGEKS
ncbi:MAG: hypothetical protein AB1568_08195 [Thermodesulfobacteriota bacterium]